MRIAIYDTRHYEMVNVLFRIFNVDGNTILFMVDRVLYNKLNAVSSEHLKNHTFIIQEDNESSESYMARCYTELQQFSADFMVLNTIDKDYKDVWGFLEKTSIPYLVTVHNINTWLDPPFTLNRLALKNNFYRKKIVKKAAMIAVQEELFIGHIKNKGLCNKPLLAIPHTLKEFETPATGNSKIVIGIPGAIDGIRRDIDLALDVIEKVNERSDRFQFVFLGKVLGPIGEKIWQRFIALKEKGLDLQHFYEAGSNKVFDEQMERCDLIFLPLKVNTKFEGNPEIYGTTKVTGVIYDMMRFSKPGIAPMGMLVPPTMKGSILVYQTKNELADLILSLDTKKGMLDELKRSAVKNSIYYTEGEIRKRVLPKLINTLKLQLTNE